MPTRLIAILSSLSVIAGCIMLGVSFSLNPGPPNNATAAQLLAFGNQYYASILWGAWLQTVGPIFIVLFAFAIVCLSGATARLAGWMTMFGASVLMTVSLIEITFYMSAVNTSAFPARPATMGFISLALIHSVQHLYYIAGAPALFISLGFVILGSRLLPHALGYLAIALGALFALAGMVYLTDQTLPMLIQIMASVQILWWVAAAIALIVKANKGIPTQARNVAFEQTR